MLIESFKPFLQKQAAQLRGWLTLRPSRFGCCSFPPWEQGKRHATQSLKDPPQGRLSFLSLSLSLTQSHTRRKNSCSSFASATTKTTADMLETTTEGDSHAQQSFASFVPPLFFVFAYFAGKLATTSSSLLAIQPFSGNPFLQWTTITVRLMIFLLTTKTDDWMYSLTLFLVAFELRKQSFYIFEENC